MNGAIEQAQQLQSIHSPSRLSLVRIGAIAGTLDIADALIWNLFRGITPYTVFQHIASGLLGRRSFELGAVSVILGVVVHYTIAFIWTAVFYFLDRRFSFLRRRPVVSGLIYGICVYIVMNFVVLPLSALPPTRQPATVASRINGVLALMFCIGLPISLLVRRGSSHGGHHRPMTKLEN